MSTATDCLVSFDRVLLRRMTNFLPRHCRSEFEEVRLLAPGQKPPERREAPCGISIADPAVIGMWIPRVQSGTAQVANLRGNSQDQNG